MESRNLVSIRLLALMGLRYTTNYLERFGFSPAQLPPGLSLALGTASVTPIQMAQAFAVFANGGKKVVPYIIDSIRNTQEQTIYQARPLIACTTNCNSQMAVAPQAISPQNAFLITSALHDVIQHGTAKLAKQLNRTDIAGKTGTTQNQVDAWFVGFNPTIVTISWMGFDQPQSLHEYGSQAALPMWIQFMQTALKDSPVLSFEQPSGIVNVRIDPMTGKRALANDPLAMFEYFMVPYVPELDPISETEHSANAQNTNEKSDELY